MAWWGDPDARPGVVTGSHLVSVPDGGAFDGPLGVVSGFAALDALRERGVRPDRPLGVVNFVDEEGARFGVACAGSRVLTGALTPARALALTDADGVRMAAALRHGGRRPDDLGSDPEALRRVGHFVQLHVEQGRHLGDHDRAVGVGRDVWLHGRWRIEVPGVADHAGTTRLTDRRDALLAAAGLVLEIRAAAERNGCLATVGRLVVEPGGVNAVPATSRPGWTPAGPTRTPSPRPSRRSKRPSRGSAACCTPVLDPRDGVRRNPCRALSDLLDTAPVLSTGAGHDAGILAHAGVPTGMLFVRNPTGVSHAPAEHAERDDCLAGVEALTTVLADLAGASS